MNENLFIATLNTQGRRTLKTHSVKLKAIKYDEKIYFSRHKPDSDWFKNALVNPQVTILYNNQTYCGVAKMVKDDNLSKKISQLKYPGEKRAYEKRVAIEITLSE